MKIAVQISGLLRDFNESYRSLKRSLLDHYDCDIYVAAADGDDRYNAAQAEMLEEICIAYIINNDLPYNYEEVVGRWNNVKTWWFTGLHIPTRVDSVYAALYKRWQCNTLRKRHKYDVILTTRSDIVYGEPFTEEVLQYATHTMLVPHFNNWQGGINDHFYLAPEWITNLAASQAWMYEDCAQELGTPHPEKVWRHFIQQTKLPARRFAFTYYLRGREQKYRDLKGN